MVRFHRGHIAQAHEQVRAATHGAQWPRGVYVLRAKLAKQARHAFELPIRSRQRRCGIMHSFCHCKHVDKVHVPFLWLQRARRSELSASQTRTCFRCICRWQSPGRQRRNSKCACCGQVTWRDGVAEREAGHHNPFKLHCCPPHEQQRNRCGRQILCARPSEHLWREGRG